MSDQRETIDKTVAQDVSEEFCTIEVIGNIHENPTNVSYQHDFTNVDLAEVEPEIIIKENE